MGKAPKKHPKWYIEQSERQTQFRAVLDKRLETDRRLADESSKTSKT